MQTSKDVYPGATDVRSLEHNLAYLPTTLRILLENLLSGESKDVKLASIGQCMIQMTRPRVVIAPIPLGLGVQMHHQFGSRFLIECLASHGFCVSYSEVVNFSKSAACFPGTDIPMSGHFGQYIADNVDHNLRTLDGHGTFHGMGMVVAVTPELAQQHVIPRLELASNNVHNAKIAIHYYKAVKGNRVPLVYDKLPVVSVADIWKYLDVMWKVSWLLRPNRPGLSGTMQAICKGVHPGKASIHFLQMLDMDPTDMSCIYSTLHFIASENQRHGSTPIVTFDQPLWWKAKTIMAHEGERSDLVQIILILGGFHTTMSYLGCIGHLMQSSGLTDVLELVYAENAVTHMLTGKAYARAVRGHFLVDAALNAMVLSTAYGIPILEVSEGNIDNAVVTSDDIEAALRHFDVVIKYDSRLESVISDDVFERINEKLESEKSMIVSSPTGRLWVQYMHMVDLLKIFLRAQRTGDFKLYLKSLSDMLPFFAAAGHCHYTKSVYLHLQDMVKLESTRPDIYQKFMTGLFVVRRSDRYWAGLASDLVIEQSLMRTIKTTGGLTRGRGMDELQRTRWLLAHPVCAEINEAMQELTEAEYQVSEQHKDMSEARKVRDHTDCLTILKYFQDYCPFMSNDELYNTATGITADPTCNQHKALEVGNAIIQKMEGHDAFEFSFRKKDQVVCMGGHVVSSDGDKLSLDPQLLFQRLLIVANNSECNLDTALMHELSTYPPSLFDKHGHLREANKPQLAEALNSATSTTSSTKCQEITPEYTVFDGGSLIHRFLWKKGSSFNDIAAMYVEYVKTFNHPTVVFDGYISGPSIKDMTHLRRTKGAVGPKVIFSSNMTLKSKKDHFLANSANKQNFIDMLSKKLQENNVKTLNAVDDADVLIALTGVECAKSGITHVIGEDTDILVLLCHFADPGLHKLIYRSDKPGKPDRVGKCIVWDINFLRAEIGDDVARYLPLIHAIGGCDTTSRLFGIGKGVPLRKMQSNSSFMNHAKEFCHTSTKVGIQVSGEKLLVCMYGGSETDTLDALRLRKFREKVVKSISSLQIQNLPPTSDAAKYHSFRVYFQVKLWTKEQEILKPEDFGWQIHQGKFIPRTMDKLPAPDCILKVIRCQCRGECATLRCSCRKHSLHCTYACGECKGTNCSNIPSCQAVDLAEFDDIDVGLV
jgi:hypothetical protein